MLATASLGAIFSLLRAGVRHPQRHRPLAADRAEGAGRGRRLPVRRQGDRPARRGGRDPGGAARRSSTSITIGYLRRRPATFGDARADRRAADVRAGAVRPPALRALLLGHHRAAQADRARPRRHPAGAPQDAGAAPRPRPGRPVLLVHHHRLDDVELPGLRPGGRRGDRAVRRQPRPPRPGHAVASWPTRPGSPTSAPRRRSCWPAARPAWCPRRASRLRGGRLDRRAAAAGGLRLGLRGRRRPTCSCSRCPAAPTCAPASSAATPLLPVSRARSPAAAWARRWRRSTRPASRSSASWASW